MANIMPTPKEMMSLPSRGLKTSPHLWLKQKAERDQELWKTPGNGNYWIVENKYYDLSKFINSHPGGQSWIRLTKGQDITEHFVVHHLREQKARETLQKYYVGDCPNKVTRFTFKEGGFYRTLKKRILEKYSIKQIENEIVTKIYGIILLFMWIACVLSALYCQSIILGMLCAPIMTGLVGIGHNFIHHKENPFRYLLILVGFTHRQWQIMHCISHHLYPNTQLDFENSAFEPVANYLRSMPENKPSNLIIQQLGHFLLQPLNMLLKIIVHPLARGAKPDFLYAFPLLVLAIGTYMHGSFLVGLKMYLLIYCCFSYFMMKNLFCGHRVQDTWTQGAEKIEDFGEHTIYATSDTDPWITGFLSFLLVVGFNMHVAHHMFPTADHHFLPIIHEQVNKLCLEKGIKKNQKNRFECMTSIFKNFLQREPFTKK